MLLPVLLKRCGKLTKPPVGLETKLSDVNVKASKACTNTRTVFDVCLELKPLSVSKNVTWAVLAITLPAKGAANAELAAKNSKTRNRSVRTTKCCPIVAIVCTVCTACTCFNRYGKPGTYSNAFCPRHSLLIDLYAEGQHQYFVWQQRHCCAGAHSSCSQIAWFCDYPG